MQQTALSGSKCVLVICKINFEIHFLYREFDVFHFIGSTFSSRTIHSRDTGGKRKSYPSVIQSMKHALIFSVLGTFKKTIGRRNLTTYHILHLLHLFYRWNDRNIRHLRGRIIRRLKPKLRIDLGKENTKRSLHHEGKRNSQFFIHFWRKFNAVSRTDTQNLGSVPISDFRGQK